MTANNMAVLTDGVSFFTDTAIYDADGIIAAFCDKTAINELEGWGGIVSGPIELKPCFDAYVDRSFDDAVDDAAEFLRLFDLKFESRAGRPSMASFMLGGWSKARRVWEGYSVQAWDATDGVGAFTLCREQLALRPGPLVRGKPVDWSTVDASADISARGLDDFGRRVLEGQRGVTRWMRPTGGVNVVIGGAGVVTTINNRGVRATEVCRWPDRVGDGPDDRAEHVPVDVDFLRFPIIQDATGHVSRAERRRTAHEARRVA